MDGRKLWDRAGALLPLLGQSRKADTEALSDPPKITHRACSRSGSWNQLCHSPINAWPRNHTVTGFSLLLSSCDFVQLQLCQGQVDSQVSQFIWEEQEKWQKMNHMESPSASNQVWHRESIMGSASFLAPLTGNWGILKERWFLESHVGSKGGKLPAGKPEQGGLHRCQCCFTPMGGGTGILQRGKVTFIRKKMKTQLNQFKSLI